MESMVGVGERRSLEPSAWGGGQAWEPKPAFVPSLHSRRWWTFVPVSVSCCHDKSHNKQNPRSQWCLTVRLYFALSSGLAGLQQNQAGCRWPWSQAAGLCHTCLILPDPQVPEVCPSRGHFGSTRSKFVMEAHVESLLMAHR